MPEINKLGSIVGTYFSHKFEGFPRLFTNPRQVRSWGALDRVREFSPTCCVIRPLLPTHVDADGGRSQWVKIDLVYLPSVYNSYD